jgi:hypothetical protein
MAVAGDLLEFAGRPVVECPAAARVASGAVVSEAGNLPPGDRRRHAEIERETAMPKFMSSHTMPAGAMQREQVNQMAQAAQNDGTVRPYRSFLNLSEGKVFCVMEAPTKQALADWFQKMKMPCDYISSVELEGDCGNVKPT